MAPHETDEHDPDAEDGQAARLRCFLIAAGGRVFSFSGRWIHTREQNTEYILSLSYGKDSLACLGAIQHLGWPLDRIVTADVWATDTAVEHYCATRVDGVEKEKVTYNDGFYHVLQSGNNAGTIKGFPMQRGPWCQKLKLEALKQAEKMTYEKLFYHIRESGNRKGEICGFPFIGYPECQKALKVGAIRKMEKAITEGGGKLVQYLGIAADEPDRIASHIGREGIKLPLVELGWEEDLCGLWCKYNGLLSPTYENAARDGCWFCHNQGVDQLRSLRKMYPDLWELLLKWDIDSPVTFKPGRGGKPGKTVHDYERRFKLEDDGVLTPGDARFRWSQIDEPIQLSLF